MTGKPSITDLTAIFRLTNKVMPSLVPGIRLTKFEHDNISSLWAQMWKDVVIHDSLDKARNSYKNFLEINPELEEKLPWVARHFVHLMCIHYELFSEEYNKIDLDNAGITPQALELWQREAGEKRYPANPNLGKLPNNVIRLNKVEINRRVSSQ
ncbi:hypothetical protein QA596_07870 [Balneolales bacterium ANBcel1]|nr:hypothetical protein [Balneolales bacterium ANBcel1]